MTMARSTRDIVADSDALVSDLLEAMDAGVDECQLAARFAERIAVLSEEEADKAEALTYVRARAEGRAAWLREEAGRLVQEARAAESIVSRCNGGLLALLEARVARGQEGKMKLPRGGSVWIGQSISLAGPEELEAWPEQWRRLKVEPDKASAKAALEAIPEAEWPQGFALKVTSGPRFRGVPK
jgi:hypothetical protein